MLLYNGKEMTSPLGYLNVACQQYIRIWRRLTGTQVIDVNDNYELRNALITMCTDTGTQEQYRNLNTSLYIDSIPNIIDNIMENCTHYEMDTKEYMNGKLSVILSILYGKLIDYCVDDRNKDYNRMITMRVKERLIKELSEFDEGEFTDLSVFQLYALSQADLDSGYLTDYGSFE